MYPSLIRSYSLDSMVDALPNSIVKIRHEFKNYYYVVYENGFLALPDGKTVVGADASDKKKLMMQDITSKNPKQIGTHSGSIRTLLFDKPTETLLVGDYEGHVKQYK